MSEKETDNQRLDRMTRALAAGQIPPEMASAMPGKSKGKVKPIPFGYHLKWEWFRSFSFLDRIKILFGYNLVVVGVTATRHNPGEFQPIIVGKTSRDRSAVAHLQRVVLEMFEEQQPKSLVEQEKP